MKEIILFWFRRDLRLQDNCALFHALKQNKPVLPIFIFDNPVPIQRSVQNNVLKLLCLFWMVYACGTLFVILKNRTAAHNLLARLTLPMGRETWISISF